METLAEIPKIQLAKVGEKRERKGAGIPLFFGGGGAVGAAGTAASGAAGGILAVAAKIAVALVVASLGVGAYNVGRGMNPQRAHVAAKKPPQVFAGGASDQVKYEGDLSKLPSTPRRQSSVGMVSGSLDGKTPEERAADQAAAEAAAKAEAEKQTQAEQAPAEQPTAPGTPAGIDPAAMMAAAAGGAEGEGAGQAKKSGSFGSRFGALSTGMGSGKSSLAGGTGLTGGVGRAFETKSMQPSAGRATGFSTGSTARQTAARAASVGQSGRRGLARKQLDKAFHLSKASQHGSAESRSQNAMMAFENNPGVNSSIGGSGSGIGVKPTEGSSPIGTNPGGGGGAGSNPTTMEEDYGYEESTPTTPRKGKDVTPWGPLVKMASMMLLLAGVMLIVSSILAWIARASGYTLAAKLLPIAMMFAKMAAAFAAVATLMGIMILGMGQTVQGSLLTALGAITTAASLWIVFSPEVAESTKVLGGATIAMKAGLAAGMLGGVGGGLGMAGGMD